MVVSLYFYLLINKLLRKLSYFFKIVRKINSIVGVNIRRFWLINVIVGKRIGNGFIGF